MIMYRIVVHILVTLWPSFPCIGGAGPRGLLSQQTRPTRLIRDSSGNSISFRRHPSGRRLISAGRCCPENI